MITEVQINRDMTIYYATKILEDYLSNPLNITHKDYSHYVGVYKESVEYLLR